MNKDIYDIDSNPVYALVYATYAFNRARGMEADDLFKILPKMSMVMEGRMETKYMREHPSSPEARLGAAIMADEAAWNRHKGIR